MLYTSYHNNTNCEFRRFTIYRTIGAPYLDEIKKQVTKWGQQLTHHITDSIHAAEHDRRYSIRLFEGNNTIYFLSQRDHYQINILDRKMNLIHSVNKFQKYHEIDIDMPEDSSAIIQILPSTGERYGLYTIAAAHGNRIFPYLYRITVLSLIIGIAAAFIIVFRMFAGRKYG